MSDVELTAFVWVAIAVIAGVIEAANPHLGSIFVTIGAAAAALTAFLGYGLPLEGTVFVIVSGVSLALLRKRLSGRLGGRGVPSRTDALIGRQGVVTHPIDPLLGPGRVTVSGEDWAAKSAESLAAGTTIQVVSADGIVLEVRRA